MPRSLLVMILARWNGDGDDKADLSNVNIFKEFIYHWSYYNVKVTK